MKRHEGRGAGVLIGATILLSAFLLFEVQPLIAKLILPWFGGTAAVWTACMLFFQSALLAGYAYAHWLSKRSGVRQILIHTGLLLVSLAWLPILPAERWKPVGAGEPLAGILGLLIATAGLPYFLLSTTGPLLQSWYWRARGGAMPWRFFALSNAGSLLGLLSYPVLVEPFLAGRQQAWMWSAGYAMFVLLCGGSAFLFRGAGHSEETQPANATVESAQPAVAPAPVQRLIWLALAACASALLLTVTTHLTLNVAPIPLLWVLPLSLYLLSFILCFDSERWYRRGIFAPLAALGLVWMVFAVMEDYRPDARTLSVGTATAVFCAAAFAIFMVCHGELARRRPAPAHLTSFYLVMSGGGALGGLLVAAVAPVLLPADWDFPATVALVSFLFVWLIWREPGRSGAALFERKRDVAIALLPGGLLFVYAAARLSGTQRGGFPTPEYDALSLILLAAVALGFLWRGQTGAARRWAALASLLFVLTGTGLRVRGVWTNASRARVLARNFYGSLYDLDVADEGGVARYLIHGNIMHGKQLLPPLNSRMPTMYYTAASGVGLAMAKLNAAGPLRVGVIGLGAGTLAAYCKPGDRYRFYELNPLVTRIARGEFTFLRDCPGKVEVVEGDARLTLEREPSQQFDALVVDAFSSDSIPVHLLTREAFRLYWRHLKPDGVLIVNVTNHYVKLPPLIRMAAAESGKASRIVSEFDTSEWALVSSRPGFLDGGDIATMGQPIEPMAGLKMWTDDFSNVYQLLR